MKILTDPTAARAVVPRPAATTLIVRDAPTGPTRLEVLMVRRSMSASFMPGAYVFPGGAVDEADGAADSAALCDEAESAQASRIGGPTQLGASAGAFAVAALRECFEECGLWLRAPGVAARNTAPGDAGPDGALTLAALRSRLHAGVAFAALAREAGWPLFTSALEPWSHWVTPLGLPKRFDTLFFVAPAPAGQEPSVDAGETTTLAWMHPPDALEAQARGEFQMEFATISTMRSLVPFAVQGAGAVLAHARAQHHLPPLHPRLHLGRDGQRLGILLPGEPGYDEHGLH